MSHPFMRPLLATEHTEYDEGAERLAIALAGRCGLDLRVVIPVVSNPEYETIAPLLAAQIEHEAAIKLRAIRARGEEAGLTLETVARRGEEPWREIVAEAQLCGADLLITRRRGRRGVLANLLVGEMVSKVAAHAPCSVLMVPRTARLWSKRVLAAVDGSAVSASVGRAAAGIAAACGVPVSLLAVLSDERDDERARLQATLDQVRAWMVRDHPGLEVNAEWLMGRAHEVILAQARASGADLIVMGRRGETALERELLGRTAERVTGLTEGAVLLVRYESHIDQNPRSSVW
ncbi:universal stress protein [Leptothrix ochracea]|uniref:universal stress protein n=1 Tax=Leptothrix ochracea TaxID=735331 RepID=UPI0034E1EA33